MNNRIKELAEQADIHFSKSGTLDAGPNGIAKFVLYADLEKFAELIVQECVRVAMRSVDDAEPKEAWYLIEEHFGAER